MAMAITEVSTRSIAEIDLRRSTARRLSQYFAPLPYMSEVQVASFASSTDVRVLAADELPEADVLIFTSGPHHGMVSVIQCKTEPEGEHGPEATADVITRVAFEDIEPFVRRNVVSPIWQPARSRTQPAVWYRALTNWLRCIADNEPSRPILDIEESLLLTIAPVEPGHTVPVTVSPALQHEAPATQVGGLGHVSAGLLLWLESAVVDDDDA